MTQPMERHAIISPCGVYRYRLSRRWADGPSCMFIMLNPSTADALQDDPTIQRCIGFAKREGCGAMDVVNLMAFRATKPVNLPDGKSALGPDNAYWVCRTADECRGPHIAAWGAHKKAERYAKGLLHVFSARGRDLMCLKKTASGAPGHPLYVRSDSPLTLFHGGAKPDG